MNVCGNLRTFNVSTAFASGFQGKDDRRLGGPLDPSRKPFIPVLVRFDGRNTCYKFAKIAFGQIDELLTCIVNSLSEL